MSGTTKACLILFAILGFLGLLCCGGGVYFIRMSWPQISSDPVAIDKARNDIATIKLPEGYKPTQLIKIDNFFMTMTVVHYRNPAVHGEIDLAAGRLKIGDRKQGEAQIKGQFRVQQSKDEEPLIDEKLETKTLKIRGKECPFQFIQGTDPKTKAKRRRVEGNFEGKEGPAMFRMTVDDSAYRQEQVVKMLESIP